jgi:hypothetical protein
MRAQTVKRRHPNSHSSVVEDVQLVLGLGVSLGFTSRQSWITLSVDLVELSTNEISQDRSVDTYLSKMISWSTLIQPCQR